MFFELKNVNVILFLLINSGLSYSNANLICAVLDIFIFSN
ncbi:hypothetical protein EV144_10346 [Flavobacterium sp. 270]|nr:hypothetical protein EV144_10346 [Flavobacterium sp. 270]